MICYKDISFCDSKTCGKKGCKMHVENLDQKHVEKTGLLVSSVDYSGQCKEYEKRSNFEVNDADAQEDDVLPAPESEVEA
jgi:uncharacterized cysteine cluster protein YcgN (CxxCxxCC family)